MIISTTRVYLKEDNTIDYKARVSINLLDIQLISETKFYGEDLLEIVFYSNGGILVDHNYEDLVLQMTKARTQVLKKNTYDG